MEERKIDKIHAINSTLHNMNSRIKNSTNEELYNKLEKEVLIKLTELVKTA